MQTSTSPAPATGARRFRDVRLWLAAYGVALAAVALWPVPVDRGAGELLRALTTALPWLTYDVIEVTANILLFVPLGILLAIAMPQRRWVVIPLALAVTVVIECAQLLFLAERTPSLRDVVANLLGAVIGLTIVIAVERRSLGQPDGPSRSPS